MNFPTSCDTFVCLPPLTEHNAVIFGKNSDRPSNEVQEVVFYPAQSYKNGEKLQCTYIEIDQTNETAAVILSKPSWMWGAEMGANSHGVCIGNEAVWTRYEEEDTITERLLGMDLLRLGLERGTTALEGVNIMASLLEKYGQGGPCSDTMTDFSYHNSFLVADKKEAWILETAGRLWAAEKVESGFRNISNSLSIGNKIDLMSENLKEKAHELGLWDKGKEFNFSKVFGTGTCDRQDAGLTAFEDCTRGNKIFTVEGMMKILRDDDINMGGYGGGFATTGSQVSITTAEGFSAHFFTATADAEHSIFKPFIFTSKNCVGETKNTQSPSIEPDPAKVIPRFQKNVDRKHPLYRLHEEAYRTGKLRKDKNIKNAMKTLEQSLVKKVKEGLFSGCTTTTNDNPYTEAVSDEMKIYSA